MTFDASRVRLEETQGKGRYIYPLDGEEAELTFTRAGAREIIIDHTFVPRAFRERGIGEALVAHAVNQARKERVLIRPLCSFAAAQFRLHSDWRDMLAP